MIRAGDLRLPVRIYARVFIDDTPMRGLGIPIATEAEACPDNPNDRLIQLTLVAYPQSARGDKVFFTSKELGQVWCFSYDQFRVVKASLVKEAFLQGVREGWALFWSPFIGLGRAIKKLFND